MTAATADAKYCTITKWFKMDGSPDSYSVHEPGEKEPLADGFETVEAAADWAAENGYTVAAAPSPFALPYTLADFYALQVSNPEHCVLPEPGAVRALSPGDFAKLTFIPSVPGAVAEAMWVMVTEVRDGCIFTGTLANDPAALPLEHGEVVEFSAAHISDVRRAGEPNHF